MIYCGLLLAYLLDLWRVMPPSFGKLFSLQLLPAVIAGHVGIVAALFVITVLFGRVYCSVLCPLGIMQDVILRIKRRVVKLRGRRKRVRHRYYAPLKLLRYMVLAVVALCLVSGFAFPAMMLDPYSIFGRIATALFKPAVVWINDVNAAWLNEAGHYWIYLIAHQSTSAAVVTVSAVMLLAIIWLVWWRGRIWCNSICPVGTLLGMMSKYSLLGVRIDAGKCTACGVCEAACKAGCINSGGRRVDGDRCVSCFSCLDKCNFGAISYSLPRPLWCKSMSNEADTDAGDASRRTFLRNSALLAGVAAGGRVMAMVDGAEGCTVEGVERVGSVKAMPPGAVSREHFESRCTSCQLCVSKCPTQVLKPAFMENGLRGVMQPYMNFRVESFCNYECRLCTEVCPTHALTGLSIEDKKLVRVGEARLLKKYCIVKTRKQDCGACAEHCPTGAVKMVPYENGLTIPELDVRYCIGCGGCESICPVLPPAIYVQGLDRQDVALPPTKEKLEVDELDTFGF